MFCLVLLCVESESLEWIKRQVLQIKKFRWTDVTTCELVDIVILYSLISWQYCPACS
jgi:hypothetical protein